MENTGIMQTNLEKEQQLITLCKTDSKYFGTLYEWYFKDVYRYAYSLTKDQSKAEDATSHTFYTALEKISQFEQKGVSIKNWLFVILRNYIYRKNNQLGQMAGLEDAKEGLDIESGNLLEGLIMDEQVSFIKQALNNLTPEEQEIIHLRIWEDMTFNGIADLMQLSLSSVKMTFYRSLLKIRGAVANNSINENTPGLQTHIVQ
jgi:RNA polymerase sigma-70 factor (ECF subfamily)